MREQLIVDDQYNIGHICTRHQCERGRADKVAMRWISPAMEVRDYSFAELDAESNRFANVLSQLGFGNGDVFFTFLPKMPEQFIAILGALKLQLVTGTLFSNFGEEAVLDRIGDARAEIILTKKAFLKKIERIRDRLTHLRFILLVDIDTHPAPDILSCRLLMEQADETSAPPVTPPETPSLLHYTSGSTGKPKGVLHVHRSVISQSFTAENVLGLTSDDVFWCTADQGWVTGTSYGIIGPWSLGVTQVHFGGGYNAEHWFDILERERITVWYSAPTALRMLMREDEALFARYDLAGLRHISSVGEPLNPEVVHWGRKVIGKEIHDTWFQTETGAIMIANKPGLEIKPGSMGKPVAGIEVAIIDDDGRMLADGEHGNLCIKTGWPSMFVTYLNNESVYRRKFRNCWYYTGDTAYRDMEGYFWFVGRSDDIINTAGHLISPFEIESTLIEIADVAEAGVVGVPDELLFEKVIAFVALHRNCFQSRELELKIRLHVANRLSSVATPHEIVFVDNIPKNKSGKIMRRVLKARYLGIDVGDISTLEE